MKPRFIIIAIFLLAGCANLDQAFGGWVGHHVDELVKQWGPPSATHEMRDGTKVLAYSAQRHYQAQGPGIPVPFSGTYWCEVRYTANPEGTIISWAGDGNLGGCNTLLRRKGSAPE